MGHHGAFSNDQTLMSFLHNELQSGNPQAMIKPNPNSQHMNKSYQISPSFISLAVKNNEGVEGGLPWKAGRLLEIEGLLEGLRYSRAKLYSDNRKC